MSMYRTRTMRKCRLFFILYFIIIAAFPYSHSHADSEPYLASSDVPEYSPAHGDFCVPEVRHSERYMDSHNSHDDRHLHFLAEDSNPSAMPTAIKKAAPPRDIAISEIVIVQLSKPVIAVFQDRAQSCSDGFHSLYSG